MKKQFIIFFSIVLSVYTAINFYILYRGWNAMEVIADKRIFFLVVGILFAASYPLGRVLERYSLSRFSEIVVYTGSIWLAEMVYLFLMTAAIDGFRLFNYFVPIFPADPQSNFYIAVTVFIIATVTTIGGFINAKYPRIRKLQFDIPRKSSSVDQLTVAAVSDIHLGTIMGPKRLGYIINKINSINADIVLLVGDVFDEDIGRVIKNNLGDLLKKISSKNGIFAITGNHEYFGGVESAVKYLRDHGITVLRDEKISVAGAVTIIGREDLSYKGWNKQPRKTLAEIISSNSSSLPTIMLDHQPFHLQEAVDANIDLQLSGHTHHGQLWPFNFITKKVYEVSWGYKKKNNTHVYVSCGAGSWGPPIRTGNTPEILHITLRFS